MSHRRPSSGNRTTLADPISDWRTISPPIGAHADPAPTTGLHRPTGGFRQAGTPGSGIWRIVAPVSGFTSASTLSTDVSVFIPSIHRLVGPTPMPISDSGIG